MKRTKNVKSSAKPLTSGEFYTGLIAITAVILFAMFGESIIDLVLNILMPVVK